VVLPCGDDSAGLAEYTDTVVDAIGNRTELIVVAHALGGYTGPLVCTRVAVDLLVLLTAMVPAPGEPPGQWWDNTGYLAAKREQDERDGRRGAGTDPVVALFHDVPHVTVAEALTRQQRRQSETPLAQPWPLDAWPDVPTRFLLCRNDRHFPAAFMRRVVAERLGIVPDEMDSGHLPALARPVELVNRLEGYRAGLDRGRRLGRGRRGLGGARPSVSQGRA
jgi:hypothetical protein